MCTGKNRISPQTCLQSSRVECLAPKKSANYFDSFEVKHSIVPDRKNFCEAKDEKLEIFANKKRTVCCLTIFFNCARTLNMIYLSLKRVYPMNIPKNGSILCSTHRNAQPSEYTSPSCFWFSTFFLERQSLCQTKGRKKQGRLQSSLSLALSLPWKGESKGQRRLQSSLFFPSFCLT